MWHFWFTLISCFAIVFSSVSIITDNCFSYCAMALCITSVYSLSHMKQKMNQSDTKPAQYSALIECLAHWIIHIRHSPKRGWWIRFSYNCSCEKLVRISSWAADKQRSTIKWITKARSWMSAFLVFFLPLCCNFRQCLPREHDHKVLRSESLIQERSVRVWLLGKLWHTPFK